MTAPLNLRRPAPVPDEITEAFRAVAPTVEGFARDQGLIIERYRQGKAAWELRFARSAGGQAAIVLSYRERTGHVLDVSAIWWVDAFEARTRRLRSEKIAVFERRGTPAQLRDRLDTALARIDAWRTSDLGPPHGPYATWAREHTADSFRAELQRLPRR